MENEVRLIDANALIASRDLHINIGAGDNICIDIADIAKAPTIDPESLSPKGRWIKEENGVIVCSECGEEHEWEDYRASYCEDCRAKMEG